MTSFFSLEGWARIKGPKYEHVLASTHVPLINSIMKNVLRQKFRGQNFKGACTYRTKLSIFLVYFESFAGAADTWTELV